MNEPVEGWREITTCEDLCDRMPERVQGWVDALDLEQEGLLPVREAVATGDLPGACEALIACVWESCAGSWLRGGTADRPSSGVDDVLNDTFTIQGVTGKVPRNVDGGIDWYHRGPRNDHEFALLFNRHGFFGALLRSWQATGDAKYAAAFDILVRDWVTHNPPPDERTREPNWRPLEVGLRSGYSWPQSLFGFYEAKEVSPAARMMMIGCLGDHADYLMKHWGHANPNITLMELNGMGNVPMVFDIFRSGSAWLETATNGMLEQLGKQVYPDGAQNELTVGYHEVARRHFEHFADTLEQTGRDVPELFRSTLKAMWTYTAGVLRPDGHIPMNNDSDRHPKRDEVLAAAEKYGRPDWAYAASNGEQGDRPEGPPSRALPWAGQLGSRSDWDRDAHWSFFDFGPWGASHQHNDKLHLSVSGYGRDILVDSGRFAYGGVVAEKFRRPYASQSRAHNVILVDGRGQGPGPKTVDAPVDETEYGVTDGHDHARGYFSDFDGIEGKALHRRSVVYVRGRFWVVVDRLETDRSRELQALWHFHPTCTVVAEGPSVASTDAGQGNVRIRSVGDVGWDVAIVTGQEAPDLQGWYSEQYNDVQESSCAVFSATVGSTTTFAWVIVPGRGPVPDVEASLEGSDEDGVSLRIQGESYRVPVIRGAVSVA